MVRLLAVLASSILLSTFALPVARAATETLSVYTDGESVNQSTVSAIAKAFEKANPSIHVTIHVGPTGVDAVNFVKTKMAAGTMEDVFLYQSGSLFQSLDPTKNLVDLTNEPWQSRVISSYYPVVSVGKRIFGAPLGSSMGGGILYNKVVYAKLGLKIPLTWAAFMANNAKIKKAGITPVVQTYKDSWTSQLFILADQFNVQAAAPNFAALYTANMTKIAATPVALAGFQHLADVHKAGYMNKDFATTTLARGLQYLATGKGAHYPMLTFVSTNLAKSYPTLAKNVGFFAQSGPSAKSNGLTVWMPNGFFIPKTTRHLVAGKKFIAFAMSPAGIAAMSASVAPSGPYLIKGAKLSGHPSAITIDMLPYFRTNGKTAPALEFVSPIKGPNLAKITVQVGSGFLSAKQGAALYGRDVQKELVRLGIPGWGRLLN